jgi:hypothetical protein
MMIDQLAQQQEMSREYLHFQKLKHTGRQANWRVLIG